MFSFYRRNFLSILISELLFYIRSIFFQEFLWRRILSKAPNRPCIEIHDFTHFRNKSKAGNLYFWISESSFIPRVRLNPFFWNASRIFWKDARTFVPLKITRRIVSRLYEKREMPIPRSRTGSSRRLITSPLFLLFFASSADFRFLIHKKRERSAPREHADREKTFHTANLPPPSRVNFSHVSFSRCTKLRGERSSSGRFKEPDLKRKRKKGRAGA